METLVSILIIIVGALGFGFYRSSKKNNQLRADKDLTVQSTSSKIVDENVESAQKEIDEIEDEMDEPEEDPVKFWSEYKDDDKGK